MLTDLLWNQISVPYTFDGLQATVTPAPGHPMHSSEYRGTPYTHTCTHIQKYISFIKPIIIVKINFEK